MYNTKSKKILDLIEMKSRILVIIVGMYCYRYSVTIWNGDSRTCLRVSENALNRLYVNARADEQGGVQVPFVRFSICAIVSRSFLKCQINKLFIEISVRIFISFVKLFNYLSETFLSGVKLRIQFVSDC